MCYSAHRTRITNLLCSDAQTRAQFWPTVIFDLAHLAIHEERKIAILVLCYKKMLIKII